MPVFFEMYLYIVGTIPALLTVSSSYAEDFIDAGFVALIVRHLIRFYEEEGATYMGIVSPLILAIHALLTSQGEAAQDELASLQVNMELARVLYSAVSSSFNSRNTFGHLYVCGTLLISQIGYKVYAKYIG